jgi:DNA-binding SARP family transcriptional activator
MEEAYQKTMTLYAARGMRNTAVKMYRDLEKMLKEHYQCEPDRATQAIFRKIVAPA